MITKEDIGHIIEQYTSSESYTKAISSYQDTISSAYAYRNLVDLISKYYLTTGDNSPEIFDEITQIYQEYGIREDNEYLKFVKEYYIKRINKTILTKEGIQSPSIQDKISILEKITLNNKLNEFFIHCFPGALQEIVSDRGLDISQELFKDELNTLYDYGHTSYKTGVLNTVELSSNGLSYAYRSIPERISFALNVKEGNDRRPTESRKAYYNRIFLQNLTQSVNEGKINREQYTSMREAGLTIIDFYCSSKTSCIAILDQNHQKHLSEREILDQKKQIIDNYPKICEKIEKNIIKKITSELTRLRLTKTKGENQKGFITIINNIEKSNSDIESLKDLENSLNLARTSYPDLVISIEELIDNVLINESISRINKLNHTGYGNGYDVEDGKISTNDMYIAEIPMPAEVWFKNHQSIIEEKPKSL